MKVARKMVFSKVAWKTAVVLLLMAVLVLFTACGKKNEAAQAESIVAEIAIPVSVIVAGQGQSAGEFVATGTLEPVNTAQVAATQGGVIRAMLVEVGDRVRQGQVLARIDDTDYRLGVNQAEAAYQSALIAFQTTERDYQRLSSLVEAGAISNSEYDRATMGYKSARYGLDQAKAMLDMARKRLAETSVRAPFSGQIVNRLASVGNRVDPMTNPLIFVMVDNSRLRATLKLPENRAALVKPGDAVKIVLPTDGRTFETKIDVITDSVDPMTHTRTAVTWIRNTADNPVPGGVFFEAHIQSAALAGKMLLPNSAVRAEADGKYTVFVVEQGKTVPRTVTGRFLADGSEFIVESGIAAGEQVVLEATMVRAGQTVTVSGENAAPAPPPAAAQPVPAAAPAAQE